MWVNVTFLPVCKQYWKTRLNKLVNILNWIIWRFHLRKNLSPTLSLPCSELFTFYPNQFCPKIPLPVRHDNPIASERNDEQRKKKWRASIMHKIVKITKISTRARGQKGAKSPFVDFHIWQRSDNCCWLWFSAALIAKHVTLIDLRDACFWTVSIRMHKVYVTFQVRL